MILSSLRFRQQFKDRGEHLYLSMMITVDLVIGLAVNLLGDLQEFDSLLETAGKLFFFEFPPKGTTFRTVSLA